MGNIRKYKKAVKAFRKAVGSGHPTRANMLSRPRQFNVVTICGCAMRGPGPVENRDGELVDFIYGGTSHYELERNNRHLDLYGFEKGFITSNHEFVDRRTAGKIAYAAGQTERDYGAITSDRINWWGKYGESPVRVMSI